MNSTTYRGLNLNGFYNTPTNNKVLGLLRGDPLYYRQIELNTLVVLFLKINSLKSSFVADRTPESKSIVADKPPEKGKRKIDS